MWSCVLGRVGSCATSATTWVSSLQNETWQDCQWSKIILHDYNYQVTNVVIWCWNFCFLCTWGTDPHVRHCTYTNGFLFIMYEHTQTMKLALSWAGLYALSHNYEMILVLYSTITVSSNIILIIVTWNKISLSNAVA